MPRLKAASVHLLASLLVAALALIVIFHVWYPAPLAGLFGVGAIVLMLLSIDVVLGPVLTFAVFDRRKKSLSFDLAVIALLQAVALAYGLHVIFLGRPALIVYNVDRFDAVRAADMDAASLAKARAAGKSGLPWFGPRLVAAVVPTDIAERNAQMFAALKGGPDLPQLAHLHVPYAQATDAVLAHAKPLAGLQRSNGLSDADWAATVGTLGRPEADLAYLPLVAKQNEGVVIVDRTTAAVIRILALKPEWN